MLQGSPLEASRVRTAAARALRCHLRKRAAGARDDGKERESRVRMSPAGMEREAESQRRAAQLPPQPLRKQVGKGKRCARRHYGLLLLIFFSWPRSSFLDPRNYAAKIPGSPRWAAPPSTHSSGEETLADIMQHGSTLLGLAALQMYMFAC